MAEPSGNPFANYQPPEIGGIFSEEGKAAMLELRLESLSEAVKARMLEDGQIERFLEDGEPFETRYDCSQLRTNPVIITSSALEIDLVKQTVLFAASQALTENERVPKGGMSIRVDYEQDEDNLDFVGITLTAILD